MALDKVTYATDEPNLRLDQWPATTQSSRAAGLSNRMRTVVGLFKQKDYLVVFDSPPIDLFTDAAVLSSYADGTLLVVDATRSRRRVVQRARETLARAGANTLGAVLNRVSVGSTSIYGDYRGFLGHHAARSTSQAPMNEGTHERSAG